MKREHGNKRRILPGLFLGLLASVGPLLAAPGDVSLAWDPSPDTNVVGYAIYYGTNAGNYATRVPVGSRTNTVIAGVTNGGTYYFVATAYTAEGLESLPSNEVSYAVPSGSLPDFTLPVVTINSPAGAIFTTTNSTVNVAGTASDNVGVVQVRWTNACGQISGVAVGTTSWSVNNLPLCVGTNVIVIRALDAPGNIGSATRTVVRTLPAADSVVVSPTDFAPTTGGTNFCVTVTASSGQLWLAASGCDWVRLTSAAVQTGTGAACFIADANTNCTSRVGSVTVAGRTVSVVQSAATPLALAGGTFNGLFTNAASGSNAGFLTLKASASGAFSGSLKRVDGTWSFKGQFDAARSATLLATRSGQSPQALQLQLGGCDAADLSGTVSDGNTTAVLGAHRNVFNALTSPCPYAGKYTFVVPGTATNGGSPRGHGYGTVTVAANGTMRIAGALGDGAKLKVAGWVGRDGALPVYQSLYRKSGLVIGWLDAHDNLTYGNPHGTLLWTKHAFLADRLYPAGFTNAIAIAGSRYVPPVLPTDYVLGFTNGTVAFRDGNLPGNLARDLTVLPGNSVVAAPPADASSGSLSLKIKTSQGLFSGSVSLPLLGRSLKYQGAVLQNLDAGYGYFAGTNETGQVHFAAPEN